MRRKSQAIVLPNPIFVQYFQGIFSIFIKLQAEITAAIKQCFQLKAWFCLQDDFLPCLCVLTSYIKIPERLFVWNENANSVQQRTLVSLPSSLHTLVPLLIQTQKRRFSVCKCFGSLYSFQFKSSPGHLPDPPQPTTHTVFFKEEAGVKR